MLPGFLYSLGKAWPIIVHVPPMRERQPHRRGPKVVELRPETRHQGISVVRGLVDR